MEKVVELMSEKSEYKSGENCPKSDPKTIEEEFKKWITKQFKKQVKKLSEKWL